MLNWSRRRASAAVGHVRAHQLCTPPYL